MTPEAIARLAAVARQLTDICDQLKEACSELEACMAPPEELTVAALKKYGEDYAWFQACRSRYVKARKVCQFRELPDIGDWHLTEDKQLVKPEVQGLLVHFHVWTIYSNPPKGFRDWKEFRAKVLNQWAAGRPSDLVPIAVSR